MSPIPDYSPGKVPLRVLVLEDNPVDGELVLHQLRRGGFQVEADLAHNADEFIRLIQSSPYHIILADYNLPQWTGMGALMALRERALDIPLILVSGSLGEEKAVDCLRQGATDYILKDRLTRLPVSVTRALEEKRIRDEREHAQEELARKVQELARKNAELEEFNFVASHDLQEPLRMVAAYTELLARKYHGKLDPEADKYIDFAVEGAVRMQTLILDMLAFCSLGRDRPDRCAIDCNLVVDQVLANLQTIVKESGVVITRSPLPRIVADREQLISVFNHLIGNAIKFRSLNAPAIVRIAAEKKGQQWFFTVSDNGIGIAREYFHHIFAIFKRLHAREDYPGNGIGLSICRRIVENHGGNIWVESEPGAGAVFTFSLPETVPLLGKDDGEGESHLQVASNAATAEK